MSSWKPASSALRFDRIAFAAGDGRMLGRLDAPTAAAIIDTIAHGAAGASASGGAQGAVTRVLAYQRARVSAHAIRNPVLRAAAVARARADLDARIGRALSAAEIDRLHALLDRGTGGSQVR